MATRAPKRRKLTPPPSDKEDAAPGSKKIQKSFFKNAAGWALEQDYENRKWKGKKKSKKESTRLPIKTADGRIERSRLAEEDDAAAESIDSDVEVGEDVVASSPEPEEQKTPPQPEIPEREQILQAQEKLAKLAADMSEDPEDHLGAFKKQMAEYAESKLHSVQKLALVTQMAVYKDIIPGYRIRALAETQQKEKVSKEVDKLRTYEQSLVKGYQGYVAQLKKHSKTSERQQQPHGSKRSAGGKGQSISTVAVNCACTLVTDVPHFNFREDLLRILVNKLSKRRIDADFTRCLRALETLFHDDDEGRPSQEAVSLLSKMMRARDYKVDESVVNLFLHLRLLSEYSGKASQDRADADADGNADGPQALKAQKKAERKKFLNKRERKALKEQKAIEKDMQQADALVSHEERDKMQSETLKLVFATYFRVLKMRVPHLMGAVLEGLAKYAHLINQDFFGDLLEALKDLIRHAEEDGKRVAGQGEDGDGKGQQEEDGPPEDDGGDDDDDDGDEGNVRNTSREALLCIVTAFTLLAGQDAHNARSNLHLDLSHFTTHLFKSLYPLALNPDLELTSRSLRAADPDATPSSSSSSSDKPPAATKVNLQTTTVLLLRSLTSVLLPPWNVRSVPPLRLAAFTKQLLSASLHMPDKSAQAVVGLLRDVAHTHGAKVSALWNTEERKGDGAFNPMADSVEGSNPFATTAWEGELLRLHFSPNVREGVRMLEKDIGGA